MYLFYLLLSVLLKACECDVSLTLAGIAGQNITLPCRYDSLTYGNTDMCWGRGLVPRSKCTSTILSTQDGGVIYRASPRYMLSSEGREGDVSLTILHALESDTGVYGCRVEIPGWFNDLKYNLQLFVARAPVEEPITKPTVPPPTERQVESVGFAMVDSVATVKEQGMLTYLIGNSVRTSIIFFTPLMAILVYILRRRKSHMLGGKHGHEENVYDDIHPTTPQVGQYQQPARWSSFEQQLPKA